ncbi:hypothetical protein TCAL_13858 [Tigriopus californicus]|uniref:Methyltransferase-like protein 22 n=1 Tax=Tigriopus californicus TaxID=6832 RepID=A0A553NV35_TIGCA|nr:hypothetical protein TCAL_13858 [Tigriopus californicus]
MMMNEVRLSIWEHLGSHFWILITAILWGGTDPLLKFFGRQSSVDQDPSGVFKQKNEEASNCIIRLLRELRAFFGHWKYSLTFAANQLGSATFVLALVHSDLSIAVPVTNALKFLFTLIVGRLVGESELSRRSSLGLVLILVGYEDGDLDVPRGNVTTNKKLKPTSPFEHIQRDQEGGQTASTTPSEQKQHHHRDEDQETEAQIWLEYKTQTRLNEVGAQVWRGSLFLADFLFNYPKALQGKRVLEIGAGTGLASVVALLCQPQGLVATDLAFNLDLLERNLARNVSCLSGMLSNQAQDERQDRIYRVMPCDIKTIISDKESATGVQTQTGPTLVEQVLTARQVTSSMDVYLGADLVYDQDLSEALVGLIRHIAYSLLREPSSKAQTRVVLLSIDKRYVFTLKDAEIKAPMFEHFYQELREMLGHLPPRIKAVLREHDMMDVTQFFRYQASSDLIILEVIFSS